MMQVGQMVTIKHEVRRNRHGEVTGLQRARTDRKAPITAVYLDGRIRTGISDVWEVKAGSEGEWETVIPVDQLKKQWEIEE